jgi:iron complex transport system ATP-binding protein
MDYTPRAQQPKFDMTVRTILETQSLCAGYAGKSVIGPLNLRVQEKALVGLKAINGAGKTTLLKTLAGLIKPVAGEIWIEEKKLSALSLAERASKVSIVFTDRVRLNGITVEHLVGMGCTAGSGHFSFFRKDDIKSIAGALSALGINHLSAKPLAECSDGELQKAMIARALAQGSRLMLMDEPTAFLDYIAKEELMQMLQKLVRECQVSVLFTSHDIALMEKYADQIIGL